MMNVIERLKTAARRRAAYNRTLYELETMPLDVAIDLDLYPGDFRKIAHRAVYGH